MTDSPTSKASTARRDNSAEKALLKAQRTGATVFWQERKRIETANAEKTARLRGLRLAKEAAEREAAAIAAANAPPPTAKKARKKKIAANDAQPVAANEDG